MMTAQSKMKWHCQRFLISTTTLCNEVRSVKSIGNAAYNQEKNSFANLRFPFCADAHQNPDMVMKNSELIHFGEMYISLVFLLQWLGQINYE